MKNYLLILLLFACSSKKTPQENIEFGETFEIDFKEYPELIPENSWGFNSKEFYYTFDHTDSLGNYTYDFESKNWRTKFYPLQGPNGLKKFDDFIKINDTLAFHSLSGYFGFQLVNLSSGKVEEFTFMEDMINPGKVTFQSIYYDGKKIGFPIGEYKRTDDKSYTKEAYIYGFYSLEQRKFLNFLPFPESFHNDIFSTNFLHHNFLVKGDTVLVNFAKSHEIYAYGLNSELLFTKEVKANHVNTNNPGRKENLVQNLINTEFFGKYNSLINVGDGYYRTALIFPNVEVPSSPDLKFIDKAAKNAKIHLIKLDKDFKVVAEGVASGVPMSENGVGDGVYLVYDDKLFLWFISKQQGYESMEYFKEILLK